jgi:hypothetical protein
MSEKLSYPEIIETWVRRFNKTMNEDFQPGNDSGLAPKGVKIILEQLGADEDTGEQNNKNMRLFTVFVHKKSPKGKFPAHEQSGWGLVNRPQEEVYVWAWFDIISDQVDVLPFENYDSPTELDFDFAKDLIIQTYQRDLE